MDFACDEVDIVMMTFFLFLSYFMSSARCTPLIAKYHFSTLSLIRQTELMVAILRLIELVAVSSESRE
jgi:hypothetical protein